MIIEPSPHAESTLLPATDMIDRELVELALESHARALMYPESKIQHDRANECRDELLARLAERRAAGRAKQWDGHDGEHEFVSLEQYITTRTTIPAVTVQEFAAGLERKLQGETGVTISATLREVVAEIRLASVPAEGAAEICTEMARENDEGAAAWGGDDEAGRQAGAVANTLREAERRIRAADCATGEKGNHAR